MEQTLSCQTPAGVQAKAPTSSFLILNGGPENRDIASHAKVNGISIKVAAPDEIAHDTSPVTSESGRSGQFSPAPAPESPSATSYEDSQPRDVGQQSSKPSPSCDVHAKGSYAQRKRRTYAPGTPEKKFPRLSKPVELLRTSYDVVVVGSGYGGGVAASRMARTGLSVCVLERGRERWPGEYPERSLDAFSELHCSGVFAPGPLKGLPVEGGDPTGMYHLIMGRGQSAVVGNGLGGTSLINANVFMEADKKTLQMKAWPPEIRDNPDVLDKYYKKAADVLEPEEFPADWPEPLKAKVFRKQAESVKALLQEKFGLEAKFKRVRQTTRFRNGRNSCGVEMSPSTLTGQDTTGINDGSKTTTLVTYIADAWNWGAEIFCECEVRYVEKDPAGGWRVYFAWHGRNRGVFKANLHGDLLWVKAKKAVFLGAGAIATTEILLRSKAFGLAMSDMVGQNMSGNGDILAFGYNLDERVNAIGKERINPYQPVGTTITSVIDCREGHENPMDGFVIEEGAVPHALAHFFQAMLDLMPNKKEPKENLLKRTEAALARYGGRVFGPYYKKGAAGRTQVYLVMSHDSNQAVLRLEDDKPVLEFLGVARSHHVKKLNQILQKATEAVGGTFIQNPFYELLGQQVTVHPIGGACMSRDNTGKTGVTNHVGQVFTGKGKEVYDGLVVVDAAVIPTALGANPFATIAALAERSVEAWAISHGLTISEEKNGILDLFGEPQRAPRESRLPDAHDEAHDIEEQCKLQLTEQVIRDAHEIQASGFGYTEVMSGYLHYDPKLTMDNRDTYELAFRRAKSLCESARIFLSVQAYNMEDMVKHAQHRGMVTGTFVCPTIPGSPFMVQRGEFNLFISSDHAPGTRNLTYDFDIVGINDKKYHFHGYKVVDSSVALDPSEFWKATTTLYVTVSEHVPGMCADLDDEDAWRQGAPIAKGIMHIEASDFLTQIATLKPTGSNAFSKTHSALKFLTFFTRKSLSQFLTPFMPLEYPLQTSPKFINNYTEDSKTIEITSSDGVKTRMYVWEPTHYPDNDRDNIRNLFMIPGASVDHQIFALPTIPYNAVSYFRRAGYRVFVTVHRISKLMHPGSHWTTYDTRHDLRACLEYIRENYNVEKVYTIAHCMGSVAFACGLLDGTIPADWILGITCSQVFMHPTWSPPNTVKIMIKGGGLPLLDRIYHAIAGNWFPCSTSSNPRNDPYVQRVLNQLLRLFPQPRHELCHNASCHRTTFVFGRCWNHANLNEATHRQIDRFFGGVNMTMLHLLMRMGYDGGHVMSGAPHFERLDTEENIRRLKGIPIFLFHGRDSDVLSPEATERTYEVLCDIFPDGEYRRKVVPGYGHLDCWMGRNAWRDVYPFIREEVDRVVRGEAYQFVEPDDEFKKMVRGGELLY